jgi:DNA-binding MarR family transcriptional regulator
MQKLEFVWNQCSNSSVRRAARQLGQLYDTMLEPCGLRTTQFTLMVQIHYCGNASLKNLAELMVMDLSALGHTLKPLIRDGFVTLVQDDKDKRVKRATLTNLGEAKLAEALPLWKQAQSRFDHIVGEEKSKELRAALSFVGSGELAAAFRQGANAAD